LIVSCLILLSVNPFSHFKQSWFIYSNMVLKSMLNYNLCR
jgi:hypothetical protein